MKRLPLAMMCLLIVLPVLADDDPFSAPRPPRAQPAAGQTKKPATAEKPRIASPFGNANAPVADDPFGGPPVKTATQTIKPGSRDPFGADPFDGSAKAPAAPKPVAPKHSTQTRRPSSRQAPTPSFPSLTVEAAPQSRQRIEDELSEETKFDYLDTPLKDVIDEIALRHDLPIIINTNALEDFGIGTDTPVTISLNGVSLRSALRIALRPLELTYVIEDEVLQITVPEHAESTLHSRLYLVSELLPTDRDGAYLVKLIMTHVAPDSWDQVGGPGAVTFVDHLETLTVTQTDDVLAEIDTFLASIAKLAHQRRGQKVAPTTY